MSTQLNSIVDINPALLMADGLPLPEFCGPTPDFVPYRLTPAQLKARAVWRRKYTVGRVAFYRLQARRSTNPAAASFYTAQAALFTRALRPRPSQPLSGATDIREEARSWLVMADTIASEAHLTAEDYLYA